MAFLFTRIENFLRIKRAQGLFRKKAIVGNNFSLLPSACLINDISNKNNVIIGDNCELGCSIFVEGNARVSVGNNTTIRANT